MSKVDDLIDELCPEGVPSKAINSICKVSRGRVMSKDYLRENSGEYPVYSSQTASNGVFGKINTYDYDGEYITWTTDGANAGSIFYRTGKFSITNVCGLLKVNSADVDSKYLTYILGTVAKKYVSSGMGNPKLMSNVMSAIKVPIPPLEVQKEIVNILDKFTQLEARRKQYEFYRNQLLTFSDEGGVRWTTLQEVAMLKNGSDWKKLEPGNIPVYGTGGVMATVNKIAYDKPTVLIPRKGSITNIFYLEEPFWNVDTIYYTQIDDTKMIPKFFYYYMKTIDLMKLDMGSGRPSLTQAILNRIHVPVPSLSEQNRIVTLLDKFDSLVNSISEGLPAELSARRKQYEYYRSKLLTFQELNA
jgi:type I restriction enzyme S subunit